MRISSVAGEVEVRGGRWLPPQTLRGIRRLIEPDVRYSHVLASGNGAEETIRMAHDDLIVLGAQHKRFADATVLGTTTERVIRLRRGGLGVVAPASSQTG